MIDFTNGLSAERDNHGWKLHQEIVSAAGKVRHKTTYYATFKQVCAEVVDRAAGERADVSELIGLFDSAAELLAGAGEAQAQQEATLS